MANTGLTTNFNVSPYFDDYNASKNFYRIVYNPAQAVQARELTQTQTIFQEQIKRFGDHIFKNGSLVTGGQFNLDLDLNYVKLQDTNVLSQSVNVNNFNNTEVTGSTSGVKGIIIDVATGSSSQANTKTLFIRYTSAGSDNVTNQFLPGETIVSNTGYQASVISANTAIGTGSKFEINDGVLFGKGFFLNFNKQNIILERYTNTPTYKIGFLLTEAIVTKNDDPTLNSPAQGTYNYAAPGADRLKISASLVKYANNAVTDTDFVELLDIKDGIIQNKYETTQYSVIRDELARRTYDESGNYYVEGLNVRIREHLDDGTNQGYLTLGNGGNSSLLAVGIEAGKAYINGYDIKTYVPTYVAMRKGTDYNQVTGQNISINYGNYVKAKELVGSWDVNSGTIIKLYDKAQFRISNSRWSTSSQTGNLIGTARFKSIDYDSGSMGSPDCVYKVYLYDVQMSNSDFSSVKSIYYDNTSTADIGADVVLNVDSKAQITDTNFNNGVYALPTNAARRIRDESDNITASFTFVKSFPVTVSTGGTFTLSTGTSDEEFNASVGSLNSDQKRDFIIAFNAGANVAMGGTITTNSGNTTILGSNTYFSRLNVGDKLEVATLSGTLIIDEILSNSSAKVKAAPASSVTAQTFKKVYKTGDIVDFAGIGASAGTTRTITVNTTTSATFDIKESLTNSVSATVLTKLNKTTAREAGKLVRKNRYVKISCATSGTTGPFNLGISDVYKIRFIRKGTSFSSDTDGTDVTSLYLLDNGQRDTHYDHARIINVGDSLTGSDILLVKLDYFEHDYSQGVGYFSVNSYPVDDVNGIANTSAIYTSDIPLFTSPTTGTRYDLRNCLDTRPSKTNTASNSTTIGGASSSPSTSTSFNTPLGGLHIPATNENFNIDYSYYLPRKDLITLNKDGNFSVIEGNSKTIPITPNVPNDSMSLATITVAPYPSLSPSVASQRNRTDLACSILKTGYIRYTMRDIGVIKNRVDNLEYYASLNLLEQDAVNLKIPDENGLDRFKNGIFVDPFNSHKFGNTGNADYKIAVDEKEGCIRPIFDLDDTKLEYLSGSNVTNSNNLVTLQYSQAIFAEQPYATTNRNAASQYWKFKGNMVLDPEQDFWVDTDQQPDNQINFGGTTAANTTTWSTIWDTWQNLVTGYSIKDSYGQDYTFGAAVTQINLTNLSVPQQPLTTTTNQSRSGIQLKTSYDTTNQNIGDLVVDTSLIPYIRPQTIKIYSKNLKNNTNLYVFFDDENMTDYCTQCNSTYVPSKTEGDDIVSDNNGELYLLLRLPTTGKKFRVGTKKVRITDSITNEGDATTSAEAYFVAQGLVNQKSETIISTSIPSFQTQEVSETRTLTETSNGLNLKQLVDSKSNYDIISDLAGLGAQYNNKLYCVSDPLGQTFFVNLPNNITGLFATSIDVYFQSKDPTYGVGLELRTVDGSGNITSTILPYSQCELPSSSINVSENGQTATRFYFKAPVFLLNNTQYAFIIKPEINNPNYNVWTAKLGQKDIYSGFNVVSQPYMGVMFISSNASSWSAIQDEDIKFKLNRAVFVTNTNASVVFNNQPIEKIIVANNNANYNIYGEIVKGTPKLTLTSISGGTIANNYIITGNASGTSGSVYGNSGSVYKLKNVLPNETFNVGEGVTVTYANAASTGITATITAITEPYGYIEKFESNSNILRLKSSSGSFEVNEQLRGQISNTVAYVEEFLPIKYSTADVEASYISPLGTTVSWQAKTTSNTYSLDSSYSSIDINTNNYFVTERVVIGGTQQSSLLSGNKSMYVNATLYSATDYLSPVIDLNRSHVVLVHNIINANTTNETNASGGAAINKYISQTNILAEQQDAEDMKIYVAAYRPPSTDVLVYAKILHGEDSDTFVDREWIPLTMESTNAYSSTTNVNDYKDFTYTMPTSYLTGTNGEIQYTNSQGVTFTGYKYFAIKIVLTGTNSALVPKVTDLRVIALQK